MAKDGVMPDGGLANGLLLERMKATLPGFSFTVGTTPAGKKQVIYTNWPTVGASTQPLRVGEQIGKDWLRQYFQALDEGRECVITLPTRNGGTREFKLVLDDPAVQKEALHLAALRRRNRKHERSEARREQAREKVHGASAPRIGHGLGMF
jgi:hypothetical protein